MALLKTTLGLFKAARIFFFVFLLLASLLFNATFLFWEVGTAAIRGFLAGSSALIELSSEVYELRGKSGKLTRQLDAAEIRAAKSNSNLNAAKSKLSKVQKERDDAVGQVVALNQKQAVQRKAFRSKQKKVKKRLLRVAAANVAGVPLEIWPIGGAIVVVALSTLELVEHCKLASELNDMARILDFEESDEEKAEICGMKVKDFGLSEKKIRKEQRKLEKKYFSETE